MKQVIRRPADIATFAAAIRDTDEVRGRLGKKNDKLPVLYAVGKGNSRVKDLFHAAERRTMAAGIVANFLRDDDVKVRAGGQEGLHKRDLDAALARRPEVFLEARMPAGVEVDSLGFLSGQQEIAIVPPDCMLELGNGKPVVERLQAIAEAQLEDAKPCPAEVEVDIPIPSATPADFHRFDCEFADADGEGIPYRSRQDRDIEDQKRHATNVLCALLRFAGSRAATTVLASTMTQASLPKIPHWLARQDGKAFAGLKVCGSGQQRQLELPDGTRAVVTDQMGGSKWTLSRMTDSPDFNISIDWPIYCEPARGQEDLLPLPPQHVIKVDVHLDIVVNARAAHGGEPRLSMPHPMTATFSGRMDLDRVSDLAPAPRGGEAASAGSVTTMLPGGSDVRTIPAAAAAMLRRSSSDDAVTTPRGEGAQPLRKARSRSLDLPESGDGQAPTLRKAQAFQDVSVQKDASGRDQYVFLYKRP